MSITQDDAMQQKGNEQYERKIKSLQAVIKDLQVLILKVSCLSCLCDIETCIYYLCFNYMLKHVEMSKFIWHPVSGAKLLLLQKFTYRDCGKAQNFLVRMRPWYLNKVLPECMLGMWNACVKLRWKINHVCNFWDNFSGLLQKLLICAGQMQLCVGTWNQ